jgi:hypothetical protein
MVAACFAVATSLAAPFLCQEPTKPFWTGYAVTAAVFLFLAITKNDYYEGASGRIAYFIVQCIVALVDNGSANSTLYVKLSMLHQAVLMTAVPVMGIFSGIIWNWISKEHPGR